MSDEATDFSIDTSVRVDREAKVQIPMTALGALIGGLVALVATGVIIEGFLVLLGAFAGWMVGLGAALAFDAYRKSQTPTDEMTRDRLYERAQRLGIEGRSEMTKDELAAAVRQASS